jgi:hypothetical protein
MEKKRGENKKNYEMRNENPQERPKGAGYADMRVTHRKKEGRKEAVRRCHMHRA